ncbi:MAG: MFS transporter [Ilumatobacteraceae bacterium]
MSSPTPRTEAGSRQLITGPFVSVMATALVFFVYIGMVVVTVPSFVERELDGGEFGVGLTMAAFAVAAICARPFLGRLTERFGRRALMMAGAVLASVATFAMSASTELWQVMVLRGLTGLGEAALFVAAATLIADLSPPKRRAEAASYFSVAVFGGMGVGPLIAESFIGSDDDFSSAFVAAAVLAAIAAVTVLGVPRRVDRTAGHSLEKAPLFSRAALAPGLVLASGIAAFSVFMAFAPEYSKSVGLPGAGGLLLVYSLVSVSLRVVAAKLPERLGAHRTVTIALAFLTVGLTLIGLVAESWALWVAAALIGVGMAFLYPSLMANVVNRVSESERSTALSSLTMFFEVGTIVGGVALGAVGEIASKQAGFLGGALMALVGVAVLWQFVVATPFDEAEVDLGADVDVRGSLPACDPA